MSEGKQMDNSKYKTNARENIIAFKVSKSLKEVIRTAARTKGLQMSCLIRMLLTDYLARESVTKGMPLPSRKTPKRYSVSSKTSSRSSAKAR